MTTAFAEHAENYRGHLRIGSLLLKTGDSTRTLAQSLVAAEIFPDDPFVTLVTSPLALDLGYLDLALREAERGIAAGLAYPELIRSAVRARLANGRTESALAAARLGVERHPMAPMASETHLEVLQSMVASPWRLSFARAHDNWTRGRLGAASENLLAGSSAISVGAVDSRECWDVTQALPLLEALAVGQAERLRQQMIQTGSCLPLIPKEDGQVRR